VSAIGDEDAAGRVDAALGELVELAEEGLGLERRMKCESPMTTVWPAFAPPW
jgi:hypothetical protein